MRRLGEQPLLWVLLHALVVFALLWATGRFEPYVEVDTNSYRTVSFDSLEAALTDMRTVGYPLFLRAVSGLTGSDLAAPYFHYLAFVLAVVVFCLALGSVGFSDGARGAAASVLLWSHAVFEFTAPVLPDALAISAAIVAMSALIVVARHPRSVAAWIGLAAAVFVTCQIRPAYLFLLPLAPCVGVWLAGCVFRVPLGWRNGAWLFGAFAVAAIGPLLGFAGFRWLTTGHFGLVSFAGYNLIGISGQLLDESLISELSPEVRPLARDILQRRTEQPRWEAPDDYYAIERMYNVMVWQIAVPAAEERYGAGAVEVNQAVGQLASEVIFRRPERYLRWLAWSGREGLRSLLILFITDKGTRLCLVVLLVLELIAMRRRMKGGALPAPPPPSEQRFVEVNTLLWLALGFAAAKLLLVILVEVPNHRYLSGAVVFAPTVLAVIAWHRLVQVLWSAAIYRRFSFDRETIKRPESGDKSPHSKG